MTGGVVNLNKVLNLVKVREAGRNILGVFKKITIFAARNMTSVNKNILRLAVPNIVSNIVIPMLGMIDTAIAGRIGADVNIAALAIGATIFNFIYWNCAFVRMGTSGLTAQAFGAGNRRECANMLLRSLWLALAIIVLLLALQQPVGRFSLYVMHGSEAVSSLAAEYFFARIWAVPASIALFAVHGWFIGMQDARTPMLVSIISVITNALFSLIFVYCFELGIKGIAWGTVVAQYVGLAASAALWMRKYRSLIPLFDVRESLKLRPLLQFLNINKDVFLRTFCVVIVYTFFTSVSARFGDTVLATNALLMQLFTLFSYMLDGFAYAGESLAGRFVGERNALLLKRYINKLMLWSVITGLTFAIVYIPAWRYILLIFNPSDLVLDCAGQYVGWIILVPLVGSIPFMIDGIMLGATRTRLLRNTVFASTAIYFAAFYSLSPLLGNSALWISFNLWLVMRGVLLYFCSHRLDAERIIASNKP